MTASSKAAYGGVGHSLLLLLLCCVCIYVYVNDDPPTSGCTESWLDRTTRFTSLPSVVDVRLNTYSSTLSVPSPRNPAVAVVAAAAAAAASPCCWS